MMQQDAVKRGLSQKKSSNKDFQATFLRDIPENNFIDWDKREINNSDRDIWREKQPCWAVRGRATPFLRPKMLPWRGENLRLSRLRTPRAAPDTQRHGALARTDTISNHRPNKVQRRQIPALLSRTPDKLGLFTPHLAQGIPPRSTSAQCCLPRDSPLQCAPPGARSSERLISLARVPVVSTRPTAAQGPALARCLYRPPVQEWGPKSTSATGLCGWSFTATRLRWLSPSRAGEAAVQFSLI